MQVLAQMHNDATKAAGVERIVVQGSVTLARNKISRLALSGNASDPQTQTFLKALQAKAAATPTAVPK